MTASRSVSRWLPAHVAALATGPERSARTITDADIRPVSSGLDVWDIWPVQEETGALARFGDTELWITLAAAATADPVARHGAARMHLLARDAEGWRDLGPLLPDGVSPGSREWSGCAVVDKAHARLDLYFTAAGRRGECRLTFEQRIFHTWAPLVGEGAATRPGAWAEPREAFRSDGRLYDAANQAEGAPGEIKAFRDPAFFRDPADGEDYLLFCASLGQPSSRFNGAVGLARRSAGGDWVLQPPILHADGLNNELERPHVIHRDGLYYLFWSTQREVFAPGGPSGPTGLYGMVAPALHGPYLPLNGDGLVLSNPSDAPYQAYSWWVLDDLSVVSFVNYWGFAGASPPEGEGGRRFFGGVPAPIQHIHLEGSRAWEVNAVSA